MIPNFAGFAAFDLLAQPAIPLAPVGLPGCDLYVLPSLLQVFVADAIGHATIPLSIPYKTSLCGLEVFVQTIVQDPTANATGWALTHAGLAMIR